MKSLFQTKTAKRFGGLAFSLALVFFVTSVASAFVGTTVPSSDGAYRQWTPKSGTVHYTQVDEWGTCNGNTDYDYTTTVGNRDSYGVYIPIANGALITSLAITPCASRQLSGTGSSVMKVFYRLDGTDSADAGNYSLTGTTPVQLSATTYSGLSIIKSPATSIEIGTLFSSGNQGARLSRLMLAITYTPLSAPNNLVASNVSDNQNDLTWQDNATIEDGFEIERSLDNQYSGFSQIATTSANLTSYSDTTVVTDHTYYYRVRAFNAGGNSSYTFPVASVVMPVTVVPVAPSNLMASASSTTAVLNWTDASTNEDGFAVERSLNDEFGSFTEIATTTRNVVTYTDLDLTSGTYYYRVRAFNVIGDSDYSNTTSVTLP